MILFLSPTPSLQSQDPLAFKNPMPQLIEHFQSRLSESLALLGELVRIESPTQDRERCEQMARKVVEVLAECGASVTLVPSPAGAHVLAEWDFGAAAERRAVMLLGHFDTVWPAGTIAKRPFQIRERKAYGPGVFDMKASIAMIAQVARAFADLGRKPSHPLRVLLTCDEESGSASSRELIESEAARSNAVLVLEPCLPGGVLKTARKGVARFDMEIRGRAAHAGVEPEKGLSAVEELARQILRLHSLTDHQRGISVNVGVARGGTLSNVIAAEAFAQIDARFAAMEDFERVTESITSSKPFLQGAEVRIVHTVSRPPLVRTEKTLKLFAAAQAAGRDLGMDLAEGSTGGGSDGNFTAALGVPTLDGLGIDGRGAHADHEHILVDEFPRRSALLFRLLETMPSTEGW